MKKALPIFCILLFNLFRANAQNWLKDMRDVRVNFFTVQKEFNQWWNLNKNEILQHRGAETNRDDSWMLYKRWEREMLGRMVATGGLRQNAFDTAEYNFYRDKLISATARAAANWNYIGPKDPFSFYGWSCKGRLNCVRFDPLDGNVIYAGAPSGGLWKTNDFGQNWQLLNTDNLSQIGVSDVIINPTNTQTLFIATGDYANTASLSTGVLKSVNGGQTWVNTGLIFTTSQYVTISRLIMHPTDTNVMYAATNVGIYRTMNGGNSWSKVLNQPNMLCMEFKPGNPNVIYATNDQLYRSNNAGTTWNVMTGGLPDAITSGGFGMAVTPADTNCVYILVTDTGAVSGGVLMSNFIGVYRSLDGGNNFTLQCASPDATGGYATYALVISASPVNRDVLVMGGVNSDYSNDGGVSWYTAWTSDHSDHHDIRFFGQGGDTVFTANDGGIFISTDAGNTWAGLNNGINIGQLYTTFTSFNTAGTYLTSRQDDGTLLQQDTSANSIDGGDGMMGIIDPTDDNIIYTSAQFGYIDKSTDGGVTLTNIVNSYGTGVNGLGSWECPYVLNPQNHNSLYVGKDFIYKSTDAGNSFTQLNSPPLNPNDYYGNAYVNIAIAPTDSNYIYASTYDSLFLSTDGGQTFTNITQSLPYPMYALIVSYTNPQNAWVAAYDGVYVTTNGGQTWLNYSVGLPSSPIFNVYSLVLLKNSPGALYAGLSYGGGLYYIDSTLNHWVPFDAGLPNTSIYDLKISYPAGKLRAATYGRDIWETSLYNNWYNRPSAAYQTNNSGNYCLDTIRFTDVSGFNPTSWQWSFPGGVPSNSTQQNPVVYYPSPGTYNATLIAGNPAGFDTTNQPLVVAICTGVEQVTKSGKTSVMPNPNDGNFTIQCSSVATGKIHLSILNEIGQLVYAKDIDKNQESVQYKLSLPQLSAGVYVISITLSGNNKWVSRLVIEK